jgi:hypothetical protein
MTPRTITEENNRWVVDNARPRQMRVAIGIAAPVALLFVGLAMLSDFAERNWLMLGVRVMFAAVIVMAAIFSLFGAESLAVEGDELVWQRGRSQERRCKLADVERFEREGNQLRVFVRGEKHPIIIGAGLRQEPAAIEWLKGRVEAAVTARKTGT